MEKYIVTKDDLIERDGDCYYTGPLDPAQDFLRTYASVTVDEDSNFHHVLVSTTDRPGTVTWKTCDSWGVGKTLEQAWRYALGAEFGPADSEFTPFEIGGDGDREPCEDPTPAEQADYDKVLTAQEKGWNLLDHALTEEGTWVVYSFVLRMNGSRTETTRTAPNRVVAVSMYNAIEAELRRDLSGNADLPKPRDWERAESFTLKMHGPLELVPEREAAGYCNLDADAWIINTLHRGVLLPSRQGMYGTPAHSIF